MLCRMFYFRTTLVTVTLLSLRSNELFERMHASYTERRHRPTGGYTFFIVNHVAELSHPLVNVPKCSGDLVYTLTIALCASHIYPRRCQSWRLRSSSASTPSCNTTKSRCSATILQATPTPTHKTTVLQATPTPTPKTKPDKM
jgi:hypothetical protein